MTICAAVADLEIAGRYYLAADTMGNDEGLIVPSNPKWKVLRHKGRALAMAHAGDYRAGCLAEEWLASHITQKPWDNLDTAVRSLRTALKEDGFSETKEADERTAPIDFDQHFMLVGPWGIATIDEAFGWAIWSPGFIGSGRGAALAAWTAAREADFEAHVSSHLKLAVKVAIALCINCNGKVAFGAIDL